MRPSKPPRLLTPRVVVFVLLLVATLGGIAGFTVWFNRATYYVGIDRGRIGDLRGPSRRNAVVPSNARRTQFPLAASIADANLSALRAGVLESSYSDAEQVVVTLENGGVLNRQAPGSGVGRCNDGSGNEGERPGDHDLGTFNDGAGDDGACDNGACDIGACDIGVLEEGTG